MFLLIWIVQNEVFARVSCRSLIVYSYIYIVVCKACAHIIRLIQWEARSWVSANHIVDCDSVVVVMADSELLALHLRAIESAPAYSIVCVC